MKIFQGGAGSLVVPCGQTEERTVMAKLIIGFRNFCERA